MRQIRLPRDKDRTDTECAIDYCRDAGCDQLLLIGGGGGELDHLLAIVWLFGGRRRRVQRWISADATIDCVDRSWRREDCAVGERISLLPIGRGPWRVSSAGLRWPLAGVRWRRDTTGVRNEAAAAVVSITVRRGALLVLHRFS